MTTPTQARTAIEAILASIPDSSLPKPTKIEPVDGGSCVWFGSRGRHIGTATTGGTPGPANYRTGAVAELLNEEAWHRIEQAHWQNREATR